MEESGFASTYHVQLLLDHRPKVNKSDLLAALRKRCGRVDPSRPVEQSDLLSFFFLDYQVTYTDGTVPAQFMMLIFDKPDDAGQIESSLQQTWDWPEARDVVSRCRAVMHINDFLASGLDYKVRLELFHNVLVSVLDLVPCLAIHWLQSQRIVDPGSYISERNLEKPDPLFPALNIRLFRVEERAPNEMLMDTLGLAALGIPDVQCHFIGLEPDAVAPMLFNTGNYLFEKGDIINDGETVPGIEANQRWACQHEMALVEPDRVVLDVNPGSKYAAGKRDSGKRLS